MQSVRNAAYYMQQIEDLVLVLQKPGPVGQTKMLLAMIGFYWKCYKQAAGI